MIMKRLTPEDAWRAFGKGQKVYEIREIAPERTFITELMQSENLVTFEDTPAAEKEPADEGRTEPTATEQAPLPEAVEKPKQAKRGRPRRIQ